MIPTVPLAIRLWKDRLLVVSNSKVHPDELPPLEIIVDDPALERSYAQYEEWYDPMSRKPIAVTRLIQRTIDSHEAVKATLRRKRTHSLSPLEQIYVHYPESYMRRPGTTDLVEYCLDIEVASDGGGIFPRAKEKPVLMIGSCIGNQDVVIDTVVPGEEDDRDLIQRWVDTIISVNPDIIWTYNGRYFDVPYLLERCQVHGIDTTYLKRIRLEDKNPFCGRVHYDLYEDGVSRDMSAGLMGLPNRKMKTVAGVFGIEVGQDLEDHEIRNILSLWKTEEGRERLARYLKSDVGITRSLANIYRHNFQAMAERNQVPMDALTDTYKSFIPKLIHARAFRQRGFISFLNNRDRYRRVLGRADEDSGLKYEGAYVEVKQPGRFSPVWKTDVSSQYPSAFHTLKLSPETCHIVRVSKIEQDFHFKKEDNKLILSIPDRNFNKQITIEVIQEPEGFLSKEIAQAMEYRFEIKRKLKGLERGSPEYRTQDAIQNMLKVILNSYYGLEGQLTTTYGSLPCAIACVGLCRWLMKKVVAEIESKHGKCVIEVDTDGVYLSKPVDPDELNQFVDNLMLKNFGTPGSLEFELEKPWKAGLFYKAKNYILLDENNDLSLHGNTFKSATHCTGAKRLLKELALVEVEGGRSDRRCDVLQKFGSPSMWSLDDFVVTATLRRDPSLYTAWNMRQISFAEQILFLENRPARQGDQVEYVHTNTPWTIGRSVVSKCTAKQTLTIRPLVRSEQDIDLNYYEKQITSILARFGLTQGTIRQTSIFDLLE